MTPEQEAADLSQHARRVSEDLRALVGKMAAAGWRTDEFDVPALQLVADSLGGMAIRAGLASGDAAVVSEAIGRPGRFITADDVVRDPRQA